MSLLSVSFLVICLVIPVTYQSPTYQDGPRDENPREMTSSNLIESPILDIKKVPYTCALIMLNSTVTCSCCLISEKFIATAAHCVEHLQPKPTPIYKGYPKHTIKIGVGINYNRVWEGQDEQKYLAAASVKIHEKYTDISKGYDIALIMLADPLQFTDSIKAVGRVDRKVNEDELVYITGYGNSLKEWFSDKPEPLNRPVRGNKFKVISQEKCRQQWRQADSRFTIDDQHVCVKYPHLPIDPSTVIPDPCTGDSGGPVVTGDHPSSSSQLVGVFSFTATNYCGSSKAPPAVYTSVYYYKDWIDKSIPELLRTSYQNLYFHSKPIIRTGNAWKKLLNLLMSFVNRIFHVFF